MNKMMISLGISCIGVMILSACHTPAQNTDATIAIHQSPNIAVPYQLAQHYFIRNHINTRLPVKITSATEFKHYFGEATTMDNVPTPIDFEHYYVIVVEHPLTTSAIQLNVLSLKRIQTQIVLNYSIATGKTMSYQSHPFLLLLVPKSEEGQIILKSHTAAFNTHV
ncbi:hypothetical protein PT286_06515 [Neisseriaceae bacterium ESL0693]|nr:hypothetical protein [Neisseriaceae bacterium ESL0693]